MDERGRNQSDDLIPVGYEPVPEKMAATSDWDEARIPPKESRTFSSYRSQVTLLPIIIVGINLLAMFFLVLSILRINDQRTQLIDARVEALFLQAELIAGALGESAILGEDEADLSLDPSASTNILRVMRSEGMRARLYTPRGRLMADTRLLELGGEVETRQLPPIGKEVVEEVDFAKQLYHWAESFFYKEDLPTYDPDTEKRGELYPETWSALSGNIESARRRNIEGELVVSVGVPIRQYKVILGALHVAAEGGDIDEIVYQGRVKTFQTIITGFLASAVLSLLLFIHIARPLRKLAHTADAATTGTNFARVEIPDMSRRHDEIGQLSLSLRSMTRSLYNRIEAIESFAADVSHEIKNPLTSIRSAVETLEFAKTDEARTKLLRLIKDDVARLDRLITDISDASRLDAELARERAEPVDVASLLRGLLSIYEATAEEDGAIVVLDVRDMDKTKGGFFVAGIESRLAQVVRNLVSNAISFSPPRGRILVTLSKNANRLLIKVEDEGPGIPEDNLKSVFERFYTERPEGEGFGKNSGLGLSISKQIVEAHEGKIWVENIIDPESRLVSGARFLIDLPAIDIHH